MGYDRNGYATARDLEEEEVRTKEAIASISSHFEHTKTRWELLAHLERGADAIRREMRVDQATQESRKYDGIS